MSCKRLIVANEATETLHFEADAEHRLDELNGVYHRACARPYASMARALDALQRFSF